VPPEAAGTALSSSSDFYRLLVDSVLDYAIFALDPSGRIISWNAGAERLKGYTRDEIVGRHFSIFYPPEDGDKPARYLEDARRDGRVEDEGWRLRKDGSRFWASVVITALRDSAGNLVGFAKVTRDLSERRRAELELRESEQRFRLLVEGVRDYAIFMLTPEGRVATWNEGARRIKGYSAEEIVGRHFSTFYTAPDLAAGKPARELEIASRDGTYEEEGWRIRKDGTQFWASVLITALRAEDGRLLGFAKVTRDLTERRTAELQALADARRIAQVEAENRTKSTFLTAMSHELRTPINATLGYTELIEMGVGGEISEQQHGYLARIRGSQQHLLGIINDLLNYSRMEAGLVQYELEAVDLHTVVDTVLPMLRPQALSKDLELVHGPCAEGATGWVDRARAEQIALNLLANAVKFTPSGGRVSATCARVDETVTLTVSDTGPGIDPEQQEAIFEPFVQLGRSLSSSHEGTGLGLAISRDLARAMGGELSVRSEPGEGATFTLTLPAPGAASAQAPPTEPPAGPEAG
jgi:PAS domain S-box-containing protein